MNLDQLAMGAVRAAARLRADYGIGASEPLCPFDLAEKIGVLVRLVALPSLEGVYAPGPEPTILISVERPSARRYYTCGHELGHHVFGHGTRLDELAENTPKPWSPEEFAAHRFATALLMPKLVVESAFARREWSISKPSPEELFIVAQEIGVGFVTLLGYLEYTLRYLETSVATMLRRTSLVRLRSHIAGFKVDHDLVTVDKHWNARSIDVETGDVVLLPESAGFKGTCATLASRPVPHLRATAPGVGAVKLMSDRPSIPVRVSRRNYTGLARYRHLEDARDED